MAATVVEVDDEVAFANGACDGQGGNEMIGWMNHHGSFFLWRVGVAQLRGIP